MKVLHVIVGLGSGGAERMLTDLIGALPQHEHVVISLTRESFLHEEVEANGARVEYCPSTSPIRLVRHIRRVFDAELPDVVQSWMFHADLVSALALRTHARRKLVWGLHQVAVSKEDFSFRTRTIRRVLAVISRFACRSVVCCSNAAAHEARRIGYAVRRLVVVPNGIDVHHFAPTGAHRRTEGRVLMPARWHPNKDHRTMLTAWAQTVTEFPRATLLLVGAGIDVSNAELMELIAETGTEGTVVLLGEQRDMLAVYRSADVVALSSRDEAFGLALCEGMSVGLLPVATAVGEMPHIVGDCGAVVPPLRADLLAEALRAALSPTPDMATRSARARQRIVDHYSLERAAERYEAVWVEACRTR
jgi:glycosyltransferase involved in cell wall biosynthesis